MSKKSPCTWLITGADKGLGLSAAKAALDAGDNVVVTVLAKDGGHLFKSQYPRERFRSIHLDAGDLPRIAAVVQEAEQAFGGIDVLVNNAGYGLVGAAEETAAEKYRPLFEVNFFGLVEMTRAVLPGMRRRRAGRILNLSSTGGFGASQGFAFYAATKFAVEGYSEALAQEVKPLGIHVTLIEPAGFRSDFAGPSLVSESCLIDDYLHGVGAFLSGYVATRHGTQLNDPARFGPALVRLVDAADPPLRQPLGKDGYEFVRDQCLKVLAETEKGKDIAFSTTVDD